MKFITLQGLCKSFAYGGCEGKFIPRLSIEKNQIILIKNTSTFILKNRNRLNCSKETKTTFLSTETVLRPVNQSINQIPGKLDFKNSAD